MMFANVTNTFGLIKKTLFHFSITITSLLYFNNIVKLQKHKIFIKYSLPDRPIKKNLIGFVLFFCFYSIFEYFGKSTASILSITLNDGNSPIRFVRKFFPFEKPSQ